MGGAGKHGLHAAYLERSAGRDKVIRYDDSIFVDLGPRSYESPIVSNQLADCAKLFEKWWYIRDGMSTAFCPMRPPSGSVWVAERVNGG